MKLLPQADDKRCSKIVSLMFCYSKIIPPGAREGCARAAGNAGEPEPGHGADAAQLHQAAVHHQGGGGLPQRAQVRPQHLHALRQRHPPEDRRRGRRQADRCEFVFWFLFCQLPSISISIAAIATIGCDSGQSCLGLTVTES